jgi:hypothetical protein
VWESRNNGVIWGRLAALSRALTLAKARTYASR